MSDEIRPLPGDPAKATVVAMFDLNAGNWLYTAPGDYQAAAVEAWRKDGGNFQQLIALEWPVRNRATGEESMLRLLISPEDAMGLAGVLAHTALWLQAARTIGN